VRHLVELHGGTISAQSEGKGMGATFAIGLPRLSEAGAADFLPTPPERRGTGELDRLRGRRILVVDDDPDGRELAGEALGQAGARVVTAASALEAIATAETEAPDVIVAEIGMPLVNGYELAQRLRRDPRTAAIPLVALTAYGGAEAREAALQAGFQACMMKPYDPAALASLVAGLITPIGSA
jgi:CheY-like chemotaxis protein